jgi:hypothetical protein
MWTHGYARDASFLAIGAGLGVGAVYFLASRYSKHVQTTYEEYLEQQEKVGDPNGHARHDMQPDQGDKLSLTPSSLEQDDIINEQLTRNIQFFGMEGQKKITDSFVVVVGLGVRWGCFLQLYLNIMMMNSETHICTCRELEATLPICYYELG